MSLKQFQSLMKQQVKISLHRERKEIEETFYVETSLEGFKANHLINHNEMKNP